MTRNRRRIEDTNLGIRIEDPSGIAETETLTAVNAAALRAHFQSETDQDLGRWRDGLHPELLVYPQGNEVSVIDEKRGTWGQWAAADARREAANDMLAAAAARYFEARDEQFQSVRRAVWGVLEPRLEDNITLDLNNPIQGERFAVIVDSVTRAALAAANA